MATATELADRMKSWNGDMPKSVETLDQVIRELRRIPDLEQRLADAEKRAGVALTDHDIVTLVEALNVVKQHGMTIAPKLERLLNCLRPQPIAWHDCGDGSIAEFGGWTLNLRPEIYTPTMFCWTATSAKQNGGYGGYGTSLNTLDAAKTAAAEWVRKAVTK